jgi:hypothetical protein
MVKEMNKISAQFLLTALIAFCYFPVHADVQCWVTGYDKAGKKMSMITRTLDKGGAIPAFSEKFPNHSKKIVIEGECNSDSPTQAINSSNVSNTNDEALLNFLEKNIDKFDVNKIDQNDPMSMFRFLEEAGKAVNQLCDSVGDSKLNEERKRKNLSYPWRVQATTVGRNRITQIREIGRGECDASARFSIAHETRGTFGSTTIDCGVGLKNYIKTTAVEAKCF